MTRACFRFAVWAIGLAALAGCEAASPQAQPNQVKAEPPTTEDQMPPVSKSEAAALAKKTTRPTQTASVAPHSVAPDRVGIDSTDLSDIGAVGLDETQIRSLLGPPATEVDDAPAKKLKYRNGTCSLEFSLYPDVETRVYRILTVEVNSDDGSIKGWRDCVAGLRSRLQSAAK